MDRSWEKFFTIGLARVGRGALEDTIKNAARFADAALRVAVLKLVAEDVDIWISEACERGRIDRFEGVDGERFELGIPF